ncbi:MAG: hypothetical protein Phog2KO_49600 [Phototrophicaceae bacterium]
MLEVSTLNIVLDIILIVASLWMVMTVRGVGGAVGRTLTFIVTGTVILGVAHLLSTITSRLGLFVLDGVDYDGTVHRLVVLLGFVVLVFGFRQLQAMKR